MGLFSVFMTAVGLSMDAFAIALTKGLSLRKNILKHAIKIAAFFGIAQAVMPLIGWWAGTYFERYIKSVDHWITFALLTIIGGKMIYESLKGNANEEKIEEANDLVRSESDSSKENEDELENKTLFLLAIATSIDALAVGIGFACIDVNILPAIVIIGLTTFILSLIAVLLGKKLGKFFQKYSEIIGGSILVIMGLKILIEHLFF